MGDEWFGDAGWWRDEVVDDDEVFRGEVLPLLTRLLGGTVPTDGPFDMTSDGGTGPWLDLGCGEGRVMRALTGGATTAPVIGCDVSLDLARTASKTGPVVRCLLPGLRWLRPGSLAGAYAVLTVEHLADLAGFFSATWETVAGGGALVVVANHPAFTAADAGPVVDLTDGEVLWRWGPYTTAGPTETELTAGHAVTFHHRPLGVLLTAAARAGWCLERCIEQPLSADVIAAEPGYEGQGSIPRLLGARWRRRADGDAV